MTPSFFEKWLYLSASPLLWIAVTLLAYQAAYRIYHRSGLNPIANPVLISVAFIVCVLVLTKTPYQSYFEGAQFVHFLVGPATVALAIPLYAQIERLKTMLMPLTIALLVGSITAIGSAVVIGWAFCASTETLLSLAPKSATMPIAMGVSEKIGGLPSLTALTVTITGISGAIMARRLLNLMMVEDCAVRGFAIGLTAHAIGTAASLQMSEIAGAFAALGMGLNGVATTLLLPLMLQLAGSR
jgi:predicted murein hydrolase (TIGR00659 family)